MAILVTGGAGFIGSHTVVELQGAGYEVVVLDNLSNSSVKSLERVEKITGKKVPFYKADIQWFRQRDRIPWQIYTQDRHIQQPSSLCHRHRSFFLCQGQKAGGAQTRDRPLTRRVYTAVSDARTPFRFPEDPVLRVFK